MSDEQRLPPVYVIELELEGPCRISGRNMSSDADWLRLAEWARANSDARGILARAVNLANAQIETAIDLRDLPAFDDEATA